MINVRIRLIPFNHPLACPELVEGWLSILSPPLPGGVGGEVKPGKS